VILGHNTLCFDRLSAIDFYVLQAKLGNHLDTQRLQKKTSFAQSLNATELTLKCFADGESQSV